LLASSSLDWSFKTLILMHGTMHGVSGRAASPDRATADFILKLTALVLVYSRVHIVTHSGRL